MAKLNFGVSPTSVILRVKLLNSSVTTGAGLTGLTSASAGLIIGTIKIGEATTTAYTQAGGTIETIAALGTYAAPTATKCRLKEVDATNHPGVYEIQLADARFASTDNLIISIHGATNLAQCDVEVQCTNLSSNLIQIAGAAVATGTAQLGVNVVTQANIDFGALQKTSLNAATPASVTTVTGNVDGNVGGNVTGSVGSVSGNVGGDVNGSTANVLGAVGSVAGNVDGNVSGNVTGSVTSVTNDVGITQAGADKAWSSAVRTLTANTNLNDITVADIIAGISDGSYDLQELMRLIFASTCLKSSGGGTATLKFRNSGDSKDRITATVDGNGNRTGVVLDASG